METPGINGKSFTIELRKFEVPNNNIIHAKVIKVYKRTWWRKLLNYLGFRTKLLECIKIEPDEKVK